MFDTFDSSCHNTDMPKKKSKKKVGKKASYQSVNKNFLIVIGAVIGIILVLLFTVLISLAKISVHNEDMSETVPVSTSSGY